MMKSTLVLDVGNTRTKAALFAADGDGTEQMTMVQIESTPTLRASKNAEAFIKQIFLKISEPIRESIGRIALCAVVPEVRDKLSAQLEKQFQQSPLRISAENRLPFELAYKNPKTLGADRIAFIAFASARFPNSAVIAIDFGTAITFELLSSKKNYLGGLILSGASLSANALAAQTAQLPAFSFSAQTELIGESTVECLERGLFWGMVAQTEGLILRLKAELHRRFQETDVKILATGGDAEILSAAVRFDHIEPDAVLRGAKIIAELNA